jgi:hypothetical protein
MRPREVYERPHCACCGQLVTWKTVDKEIHGRQLNFCGDRCVSVFETYLLPSQSSDLLDRLDKTAFVSPNRT